MTDNREWVERATDKSGVRKQALRHVREEPGVTVATDGVRLHVVNEGGRYPNWQGLVDEVAKKNGAVMVVDAAYLHDALPDKGTVYLRIVEGGKTLEVAWGSSHTNWRYALIQGLHIGGHDDAGLPKWPWRPISDVPVDEIVATDEEE